MWPSVVVVCAHQIIASEEVIQSIELHKETPHDIADATYLFTHKKFSVHYNGDRVRENPLSSTSICAIR